MSANSNLILPFHSPGKGEDHLPAGARAVRLELQESYLPEGHRGDWDAHGADVSEETFDEGLNLLI